MNQLYKIRSGLWLSVLGISLGLMLVSSCAHTMRGTVAMKVNDEQAHIGLGSKEVHEGDRVAVFHNVCGPRSTFPTSPAPGNTRYSASGKSVCEKQKIGEAKVERVLNNDYSIVKVNPGVKFEEGDVVEKE